MASKRLSRYDVELKLRANNHLTFGELSAHLDRMMRGKATINEQTYYNYCNRVGLYVRMWTRWM